MPPWHVTVKTFRFLSITDSLKNLVYLRSSLNRESVQNDRFQHCFRFKLKREFYIPISVKKSSWCYLKQIARMEKGAIPNNSSPLVNGRVMGKVILNAVQDGRLEYVTLRTQYSPRLQVAGVEYFDPQKFLDTKKVKKFRHKHSLLFYSYY